ncbi:unnamed protein product [Spirodela intermedia]|nr:unnamed protein product [Spirodela intermedia]CAA6670970.1 unnamed protein product [Spirodela intermedia]
MESGSELEAETRRKMEALEVLQGVVKRLQPRDDVENEQDLRKMEAAKDVRRLAKEDTEARETLAMLGAIPPLVGMLDSADVNIQEASLYALLNLGVGNDKNKAAIAEAGAVHNMVKLIQTTSLPLSLSEAIVANFLGLSALDANKPVIGSSGAIRFLVETFRNPAASHALAKQDALRALLNLSIAAENVPHIVDAGLVPDIVAAVGDMEVSDRLLSVLSNVVSTVEGRRAVRLSQEAIPILVDVLRWSDSPGCQEKAAYVLMVMAHKAYNDRATMIEAGIVSSLLELTLFGSSLAQKRASRILDCLRVNKGKQVMEGSEAGGAGFSGPAVSAPLCGSRQEEGGLEWDDEAGISEERKAVKSLVQQSLQNNMRRIVRRANLPQDFAPSDHFKTLTATSTSKSLPF